MGTWGSPGGGRAEAAPGTWPPPSGKSSVSSRTTWKPLSTSFLPPLASVCNSAGLQETTVVVNWAEGEASVSPLPPRVEPALALPPGGTLGPRTLSRQAAPPAHSCRADTGTPSRSPRPRRPARAGKPGGGTETGLGQTFLSVPART